MRQKLLLFLIILFAFIFYKETLYYFLISDDFYFISFKNIAEALLPKANFYHYNPVFWTLMFIVKSLFGANPFVFHFLTIALHISNIIVFYYFGKLLLKSTKSGLLAALIFSIFFPNYETVYWITGLNTSLMVFFYLLGLLVFISLNNPTRLLRYSTFLLFFTLALLSHEYAISLPIVCFVYWLLFNRKKIKIFDGIKIFAPPVIIIILLTAIKLMYVSKNLVVVKPSILRFIQSFIKSFTYLLLPSPPTLDSLPKILLIGLFILLIIFVLLKSLKSKIRLFLLSWLIITIIIFSLTSLPQARYFYLSSIPALLLITSIIKDDKLKWKFVYLLFIVVSGIIFLQQQKIYWRETSLITKRTLADIKSNYPTPISGQTIYFINLPDSINGPPWNAYLFRNGLDNALELYYGKKVEEIKYYRSIPPSKAIRDDPYISPDKLEQLIKKNELIFIYKEKEGTVEKL